MATGVTTTMFISTAIFLVLLTTTRGEQYFVYMDSAEECGYSVHLTDYNQCKVQTHTDESLHKNVNGYFPCYHMFLSNENVVCIQQLFVHFYNCTTRLNYYMVNSSTIKDVSFIMEQATPARTIDCESDTRNEWCTTEPSNVLLQLEKTEPSATLQDVYFVLDVARITSNKRDMVMFLDCGSTYYLKNSKMFIGLFDGEGEGESCTKTFTYYDSVDQRKSRICLEFVKWSKSRQCSSYQLQVFKEDSDRFSPVKEYKCSDDSPKDICIDGPAMTVKMIRTGGLEEEKNDFQLRIWDNYDMTSSTDSGGSNTQTIVIIVCSVISFLIILVMVIALCRGKCKGSGKGKSFPSLPSLPSFDDGDDGDY